VTLRMLNYLFILSLCTNEC